MKSERFEREKHELEKEGYEHNGGYISCPAVGGDHDLEYWVREKDGLTAEVCPHCQTTHKP
jgi:hypothetical protein